MENQAKASPVRSRSDGGEWDCPLCLKLLYEPTTADCGHSFCRRCAFELVSSSTTSPSLLSYAHSNCPICRASLPKWSLSPSIALERLLRQSFPTEYASREAEEQVATALPRRHPLNVDQAGHKMLPLFVLDPMLPGQQLFLHVFEIRYRILIQRALVDHGKRFGMVGAAMDIGTPHTPGVANFGTEVEIVNCRELADGRFHVEVIGRSAFKIIEKSMRDGYWEATVEPLGTATTTTTTNDQESSEQQQQTEDSSDNDYEPLISSTGDDIDELVHIVESKFEEWEECVRNNYWERRQSHMDDVKRHLGSRPTNDPRSLALWVAAAINPLPSLGVATEIRPAVLAATDDRDRLVIVRDALDESLKLVTTTRGTIQVCGITIYVQTIFFGVFVPIMCIIFQAQARRMIISSGVDKAMLGYFNNV